MVVGVPTVKVQEVHVTVPPGVVNVNAVLEAQAVPPAFVVSDKLVKPSRAPESVGVV